MKKLVGAFMAADKRGEDRVSERDLHGVIKKAGVGMLQRSELKTLFGKFKDDGGLFMWEDFVQFCFAPERSIGRGRYDDDDGSNGDDYDDPNRRGEQRVANRRAEKKRFSQTCF